MEPTVETLHGRLDALTSPKLHAQLMALTGPGVRLLLDLSAVDYVSSAGLRVLLQVGQAVDTHGGRLVLIGLQDSVREVFRIAGFLKIFTVQQDRASGLAALLA